MDSMARSALSGESCTYVSTSDRTPLASLQAEHAPNAITPKHKNVRRKRYVILKDFIGAI